MRSPSLLRAAFAILVSTTQNFGVSTISATASIEGITRNWAVGQQVSTTSGKLDGQAAQGATEVSEYLGIPYAKPPFEEARWQPPEAYVSDSYLNATKFGNACWQLPWATMEEENKEIVGVPDSAEAVFKAFRMGSYSVGSMSEDCLTLNVWTKPQNGESSKAVIFWVHGGSFRSGSSKFPIYNGKNIADQDDVVVVSFNYRLNVFGYPGHPDAPTNHGLRDTRLAMEWVRDNIDKFGGDKDRITMMGQSAGAGMIDHYSYAFSEDPIAGGFIMISGASDGYNGPVTPDLGEQTWRTLAGNVGCNETAASEAVLDCMMHKPAKDIVDAMAKPNLEKGADFVPMHDGVLIHADHTGMKAAEGGYLLGVADFEGGMVVPMWPYTPKFILQALGHIVINCPTADRARRAVDDGRPTWRYRYFGDFPNLEATTAPHSGSWHGSDVPVVFDTVPEDIIANTPDENALGSYMRGAFAAFAKDPSEGLLTYGKENEGWPKYDPNGKTLVRLGYNKMSRPNLAKGKHYDTLCLLHTAIHALWRRSM